jgi:FG-GAP-like repeat
MRKEQMRLSNVAFAVVALCWSMALGPAAHAETRPNGLPDLRIARGSKNIAEAWLAEPTKRYRHFVLGAQYEAGSLHAKLRDGRTLTLRLGKNSVFEDRTPRLADLDGDGNDEIVVVHSYLDRGTTLAVIGERGGRLAIIAETPPIGTPHRWINPAGIADFDGDGKLDIAYVQMPHALGRLRVWTLRPDGLKEIASVSDTANHVQGSTQQGLSAVADFNGDGVADLAIPSFDRRSLRFITFKGGARELGRKALPAPAVADFALERNAAGKPVVVVGLERGRKIKVGL